MAHSRYAYIGAGLLALCVTAWVGVVISDESPEPMVKGGGRATEQVVVAAYGATRHAAGGNAIGANPDVLNSAIRSAISDRDVEIKNVRIVDVDRRIACGDRSMPGSAVLRRFVWLGQAGIVVTDDGGPDFANLVFVCDPSRTGAR